MKNRKEQIRFALKNGKEVKATDVWLSPDKSIVTTSHLPAPKFPIEVFGAWREWMDIAAKSKSAPVDYVALSLLSAASSFLSNVRRGSVYEAWSEPTILWGILVGSPSSNKSPALDAIRDAFREIEGQMAEGFCDDFKKYERERDIAVTKKEAWLSNLHKAVAKGNPEPECPEGISEPEAPSRPRLSISDITIEKAAEVAMKNPRGLCLIRDELAGLFANLERHGGSDREFYLESYGGRRYTVDRKKHAEPYIIDYLSIVILGTIQPDKLSRLLTQTEDDGFAARFLYAWPESVKFMEPERSLDKAFLLGAFERLYAIKLEEKGPKLIEFEPSAKDHFIQWRIKQLPRLEKDEEGVMLSFIGKMPGTVIRLATTLEYLMWAIETKKTEPRSISLKNVRRAITLAEQYLLPMAERCLSEHAVPQRQADARRVGNWILKTQPERINARTMRRARILNTSDVIRYEAAIGLLIEFGWLKPIPDTTVTAGRKQKSYDVNPHLLS